MTAELAGLFEYGIQTERSDVRAHVSVVNRTIYVFQTRHGLDAIDAKPRHKCCAWQQGTEEPTAEGWLVPVEEIADIRRVRFHSWLGWTQFRRDLSTSRKGTLAVACVLGAMRRGHFPFWVTGIEQEDRDLQLSGVDVIAACRQRVQVKCDYYGGDRPSGTGNLFLQCAERNPLKRI